MLERALYPSQWVIPASFDAPRLHEFLRHQELPTGMVWNVRPHDEAVIVLGDFKTLSHFRATILKGAVQLMGAEASTRRTDTLGY